MGKEIPENDRQLEMVLSKIHGWKQYLKQFEGDLTQEEVDEALDYLGKLLKLKEKLENF